MSYSGGTMRCNERIWCLCVFVEQVLSYAAPRGELHGPDGWNLEDSSYDGLAEVEEENGRRMSNGLGQMTDGILGESLDTLTAAAAPGNITNWIGWTGLDNVELVFQFRDTRQFDNCTIHVAQSTRHGVEVTIIIINCFSISENHVLIFF